MPDVRLITLDPAHFHAALVQKEMYSQVAPEVHVYGPLTTDLTTHINRIVGFNNRAERPTKWELEVHANNDFLSRMLKEKLGNVVVLSGRNRQKINYIYESVKAGLNVLADKPWILVPEDLPKLKAALDTADENRLIALDIMTERFEITTMLQRALVNDPAIIGDLLPGTPEDPCITMKSVHFLMKTVAGVPLRRPDWYFNIHQQGEGLSDVGTHLVDLVPWLVFPDQAINYESDIKMHNARRWPTVISKPDFQKVTGEAEFPEYLAEYVKNDSLDYFCNTAVTYSVKGVHATLDVLWDFVAEPGAGDTHVAIVKGSKSRVEILQGKEQNYVPELYIVPQEGYADEIASILPDRIAALQSQFAGINATKENDKWKLIIPDSYRVGHEAHFAEVTNQFLKYLANPDSLPAWEKPNMLAKYYVTTQGVAMARENSQ